MIRINQLKLQIPHTEEALEKKIQKTLHLKKGDSFTYRIHRQSLDARRNRSCSMCIRLMSLFPMRMLF